MPLLMPSLNAVLIGERAEAAGKHGSSCIDVFIDEPSFVHYTQRCWDGAWACVWLPPVRETISSVCRNSKGSIDSPAGTINRRRSLTPLCHI